MTDPIKITKQNNTSFREYDILKKEGGGQNYSAPPPNRNETKITILILDDNGC